MRLTPQQRNAAIPVSVCGIPALAHVTRYEVVPPWRGSARTCPSADDYYGYTELDYTLYDRKGYPAEWLERKLDKDAMERVEEQILSTKGA